MAAFTYNGNADRSNPLSITDYLTLVSKGLFMTVLGEGIGLIGTVNFGSAPAPIFQTQPEEQ